MPSLQLQMEKETTASSYPYLAGTMCSGPRKPSPPSTSPVLINAGSGDVTVKMAEEGSAILLELAANDDLAGFKQAVEDAGGVSLDAPALWYSRSIGPASSPARSMGYAHRTPAMIAALYGSTTVLSYILGRNSADVSRRCGADSATALHCAASGGSTASLDAVRLLINASADVDLVDANGNRPGDVIAKQFSASMARDLEVLLKAPCPRVSSPSKEMERVPAGGEKKEYPPDLTLPDIKNGIYGTDEFRMYTFKVKPCSRAYSHDWTECPFVHPGENARRRDPRKFSYSCVPCPDFRKGSCLKGDSCEYAHGVFECWLHPAQYRTRLCKDETGCNRRVCFFAHKVEELRLVNPTAASVSGHVLSSPRSSGLGVSSMDMMAAFMMPMSPSSSSSSPMSSPSAWINSSGSMVQPPPALQLPSSRLKSSLRARDLDFDLELMGLEGYQQKLLDEISISTAASLRPNWKSNSLNSAASDYADLFSSLDPSILSQLQGLSLKNSSGYGSNLPSSPTVTASSSSFGSDHSIAKAIMNSRQSAFAKRSQSFIDRGAAPRHPPGLSSPLMSTQPSSPLAASDWGSPDGKLDWGIQGDELSKLRKSATFNFRTNGNKNFAGTIPGKDPDRQSWAHHLAKDGPILPASASPKGLLPIGRIGLEQQKQYQHSSSGGNNGGAAGDFLSWEQLYAEQELMQMVA
ncbi:Zinc finger CCCH domain-containing protein 66 [Platanthera zijinensis]|uniref:Zinc finger CCCH domain-containing protein 66 n=1 Tax=Platanthera zijinensis TaxID=2320716 RepID=A0AAP0FZJ2_9ASPA